MESELEINHSIEKDVMNNIFKGDYANTIYPILKEEQYGGTEAAEYIEKVLFRLEIDQGKILDVCCGEFTDGLYLVNRGHKVDGLDGSEEFINIARNKSPLSVFMRSNVEDDWVKELGYYDLVYMMASWFLIDNPRKLVENISKTLSEKGYFVFDFSNKDAYSDSIIRKNEDFSSFKRDVEVRVENGVRIAKYRYYIDDNRTIDVEHVTKLYSLWEVVDLLTPYFIVHEAFSGLTFNEVNWKEDKFVTIIAKRN